MVKRLFKKAELKVYRERLLALRGRLRGDVSKMAENALESNGDHSSVPLHMADIGSDNFEQEFTLSLMANDEGTLVAIEDALSRVEAGTYGICEGEDCGANIPKTRLNAIPHTPYCVKCAEKNQR